MRELDNFGISRSQELQHTLNNENYKKKSKFALLSFSDQNKMSMSTIDINVKVCD